MWVTLYSCSADFSLALQFFRVPAHKLPYIISHNELRMQIQPFGSYFPRSRLLNANFSYHTWVSLAPRVQRVLLNSSAVS